MIRYGSICSGIEAATVAWHSLGWSPAFFAEIDKFPSAVLAHHYSDVPNLGDFTTIQETDYHGAIDLLVGGTPCQSFSVAGKRLGLDDPRGNLAIEFLALARRIRPRWLVFENVPGLLSSDGGRDFGTFLGLLGKIGYGFAYRVLDAQYFGLAQRRKRLFVIGHFTDWRPAAAVLFEPESLCGHTPPGRKTGAEIAGTLEARAGTGGYDPGAHGAASGHLVAYGGNKCSGSLDIATACNAKGGSGRMDFESETLVTFDNRQNPAAGSVAPDAGTVVPILEAGARTGVSTDDPRAGMGIGENGDPMFTLQSGKQHAVAVSPRGREGGSQLEVGTQRSNALRASQGGSDKAHLFDGTAVRRLTPIECERLQGFPDNYTRISWRGRPALSCPDGPRYKAIGNSMAVNVMRWIGQRIEMAEALFGGKTKGM